jgi:hypothetical protein
MTTEIARHVTPIAVPTRVGQATAVEQSRAVAEVQAAVVVAQQCPRDMQVALQQMQDACAQQYLAERAFFRYNRGGSAVNGPSVHLARELARCWGNVQYGISELKRDTAAGESEMLAFAWDVQTNTRSSNTFIVAHVRDTKKGPTRLEDQRDIYENNANMGARRLREAIFSVLPPWFVDEAKQRCKDTVENGGGVPLPKRIESIVARFAEFGISQDKLEVKVGRASSAWTAHDVAQLVVIGRSISTGEVSADDEFPQDSVTGEAIREQASRRSGQRPTVQRRSPQPATTDALPVEDPPAGFDPTTDPSWAGDRS